MDHVALFALGMLLGVIGSGVIVRDVTVLQMQRKHNRRLDDILRQFGDDFKVPEKSETAKAVSAAVISTGNSA